MESLGYGSMVAAPAYVDTSKKSEYEVTDHSQHLMKRILCTDWMMRYTRRRSSQMAVENILLQEQFLTILEVSALS
ncbi:hypothetical protein ANCCAN_19823 [Ancylostoma caninum]|uniref:Uncharacterized protein n=1 Tax=Ancylostoma caninum TaxID=29170 RepID=A0A368FQA5_ANCCA|nr:hypothetical protein ANCCAN_19823 [Ancylostoma caninum]